MSADFDTVYPTTSHVEAGGHHVIDEPWEAECRRCGKRIDLDHYNDMLVHDEDHAREDEEDAAMVRSAAKLPDKVPEVINWEARYVAELKRRQNQQRRAAQANIAVMNLQIKLQESRREAKRYRLKYEASNTKQFDLLKERLGLIQDLASLPILVVPS